MQFLSFCVLLAALIGPLGDERLAWPADEYTLAWSVGLIATFGGWGKYLAWRASRRDDSPQSKRRSLARFYAHRRGLLWLWIGISPLCLIGIGWGDYGRRAFLVPESLTALFFWWSFPSLVVMSLLDAAEHQLYRAWQVTAPASPRHRWWMIVVPCFCTCVLWDITRFVTRSILGDEYASPLVAVAILSLLTLAILPRLIVSTWSTEPITTYRGIETAIKAWTSVGERSHGVRLWKTDDSIAGAVVLGWCRRFRYLLLSDLLLAKLTPDEQAMIVFHEAAHCQRWHPWLRVLPVGTLAIPLFAIHLDPLRTLLFNGLPWSIGLSQLGTVVVSIFAMCFLLSRVARWSEIDADRFAVQLASRWSVQLASEERGLFSQQMAARALIRALEKLTPPKYSSTETWLHPSLERRIASLSREYFMESVGLVESIEPVVCASSPFSANGIRF